ncbi:MAG: serine protease [Lachnospiraceae bacterium]|nr:serine protease [Lachnospiraceae bacterium]
MEDQQKFEFITEKVKERPINKKKFMRRTILTVSMAVIFGLIACLTFSLLEPIISNWLHPQDKIEKIEIPVVSEEILPQDMMVHDETTLEPTQEVIETIKDELELGTAEYQKLYRNIHSLVRKIQGAEVTVTGVTREVDLFNAVYENRDKRLGYIFAQNSTEIMIMAESKNVSDSEDLEVTFADGSKVQGKIRGKDKNTGLAVLVVEKQNMSKNTLETIEFLELGSSDLSTLLASPVIAMGNPLGNSSVVYGMITSIDRVINMADCNYKLLTTDIYGSKNAGGILIDLNGKVVGIINQNFNEEETANLISALGISEIKSALQRMSNGLENNYVGIMGTNVPAKIVTTKDIPAGVYVTEIVMDSPAMRGGIQSGDIIVSMDKKKISSFADYIKILSECTPGDTKEVVLMRQSQEVYKTAKVEVVIESLQ